MQLRVQAMTVLETKFLGMDVLKDLYEHDSDFSTLWHACEHGGFEKYYRMNGYLFKHNRLCVPECSMREVLVRESHSGGIMGHFGVTKTYETLSQHFLLA